MVLFTKTNDFVFCCVLHHQALLDNLITCGVYASTTMSTNRISRHAVIVDKEALAEERHFARMNVRPDVVQRLEFQDKLKTFGNNLVNVMQNF